MFILVNLWKGLFQPSATVWICLFRIKSVWVYKQVLKPIQAVYKCTYCLSIIVSMSLVIMHIFTLHLHLPYPNMSLLLYKCPGPICSNTPCFISLGVSARLRSQDGLQNGFKNKNSYKSTNCFNINHSKGAHFQSSQRIYFNNEMERCPMHITALALIYAAEWGDAVICAQEENTQPFSDGIQLCSVAVLPAHLASFMIHLESYARTLYLAVLIFYWSYLIYDHQSPK